MLALKSFVANVHAYLQIGFNNIKSWLWRLYTQIFYTTYYTQVFFKHIIAEIPGLSPASTLISQQRLLGKVIYNYTL